ncbi:hypothetical protein ACFWBX_26105 [Streptomyces sp. NPDC059991]
MSITKRAAAILATAVAVFSLTVGAIAIQDNGHSTTQAGTVTNHP